MIVSCGDPGTCPSPLHIVDERETFLGVYPRRDGVADGKVLSISTPVIHASIFDNGHIAIHLRIDAAERRALAAELLKGLDN